MNPILKFVAIVAGLFLAALIIQGVMFVLAPCTVSWHCSDVTQGYGPLYSETELVQVAMSAMMADKKIRTVTPNDDTTGSLGVNTWTALPEGPDAASLYAYIRKTTTKHYFCWDSQGNVYAQNKNDGVKAEPKDAKKQRPCKRPEPF